MGKVQWKIIGQMAKFFAAGSNEFKVNGQANWRQNASRYVELLLSDVFITLFLITNYYVLTVWRSHVHMSRCCYVSDFFMALFQTQKRVYYICICLGKKKALQDHQSSTPPKNVYIYSEKAHLNFKSLVCMAPFNYLSFNMHAGTWVLSPVFNNMSWPLGAKLACTLLLGRLLL
jgi:hypothetical protein